MVAAAGKLAATRLDMCCWLYDKRRRCIAALHVYLAHKCELRQLLFMPLDCLRVRDCTAVTLFWAAVCCMMWTYAHR